MDDSCLGDRNIVLDPIFSSKTQAFCQKAITELGHFDISFD